MNPIEFDSKADKNRQVLNRNLEEKELQRQHIISLNKQASAPVLADLARAGFSLDWVSDLYSHRLKYKTAIPILLKWLPLVENLDVKEDIVRALSVSWAKPVAAKALVEEFVKQQNETDTGLKWAIANALSIVADDSVFSEIVALVQDSHHGKSREMLAVALGNMKDARAVDILVSLLEDKVVAGHAIIGLGKLKSTKAMPAIEQFLTHQKAWIRREAKIALMKIEKASKQ